ncbi:carbohydrate ABC transporter permease [Arthrobacter dokdonensis]|uniref:carbohydrate ABC transporter permease n=1 Tax=Arthrobacter dokdonellae TaxID=2211210 RepID=UPI000DE5AC6F|nr:carbohydrate ABC transporter permease [Arthrobacter dokdonellae]
MSLLTRKRPGSRKVAGRPARPLWNIAAIVAGLAWVFPVYWMINSSMLPANQLLNNTPTFFPFTPDFSAYQSVLGTAQFWSSLRMSLIVTCAAVALAIVSACLAAVTLSRFRFRARRWIIVFVLVIQMIPTEAIFISQYKMLDAWHLLNSAAGLAILYAGTVLPFITWMLKGFVDGVPVELEESAMVSGCTRLGAFFRVTLPLLGPGLVATGVFGFLAAWNEFTLALVMLTNSDKTTLPLWLQTFQTANRGTDWGGVMAGSTVVAIPVIIIFLCVQNQMTKGMVAGAVKG